MSGLRWAALVAAWIFILALLYWLVTLPTCADMTGAGYCWGDR